MKTVTILGDVDASKADERQLRAALVVQLKRLIVDRKLTQLEAAKIANIQQPDLSRLLRGQSRTMSLGKLLRSITAFGQDVEITVRPRSKDGERGHIAFLAV